MIAPAIALIVAAPADRAAVIASARAAIARQDNAAAIALLESARAASPQDPEILRLLGSAYAYAHRYPEAIATLSRAETLAPADLDIKAALARAYLWSGDRAAARREVAAIETSAPDNEDARQIGAQIDSASAVPGPGGVGFAIAESLSRVDISGGRDRTWSTTTLSVFGKVAAETTLSLQAEREDRQTAIDTRLEARIDQRFGGGISGHLAIAGTPNADFRERFGIAAGIEATLTSRLTLVADVRHADYGSATVTAFEPGFRFTLPAAGTSLSARMINLWDETGTHRSGVTGRLDKEFASGVTLYAGAATYPDTEAGVTRQVAAAFAGGAFPVSARVTLRAGVDYERRRTSYTRKGASLGLQFKF
jgi:YaiO family outer membrane protein